MCSVWVRAFLSGFVYSSVGLDGFGVGSGGLEVGSGGFIMFPCIMDTCIMYP